MVKGDFSGHPCGFNTCAHGSQFRGCLLGKRLKAPLQGGSPRMRASKALSYLCICLCALQRVVLVHLRSKSSQPFFPGWWVKVPMEGSSLILTDCLIVPLLAPFYTQHLLFLFISHDLPWKTTLQVPVALAPITECHQARLLTQYLNNPN